MKRSGLGIFEGYDPVIESMLLEWEVDMQATAAGIRRSKGADTAGDCASGGGSGGAVSKNWRQLREAGVVWDGQSRVKELRDVV